MTPEEFKAERERLGFSQVELAIAFEVPRNTIARWERGEMRIQQPTILRLAFEALRRAQSEIRRTA
jgi:DNA-binding transcriptional regulator YiaG